MKELIEMIAKALVDQPDHVRVTRREEERVIVFELAVAQEDRGKVIGRHGRIAKALRTVVGAAAVQESKRVLVEIV